MKRAAVNAGFAQKAGRIATQDSFARFVKDCAVAADIGAKIVAAIGVVEDQRAVAILVSAEQTETQDADAAVTAFLDNMGDVRLLADRAIGIR